MNKTKYIRTTSGGLMPIRVRQSQSQEKNREKAKKREPGKIKKA